MRRVLTLAGVLTLGVAVTLAASWVVATAQDTWNAPAEAKAQENPVPMSEDSIATGKKIAAQSCGPCHGASGKGDGPAAAALPKKPADWGIDAVQSQTDGELFWKISKGKPPMPPWESLPENDRWSLVNYIRSLGKK